MPRYTFNVTRDTTETARVTIFADTIEEAHQLAITQEHDYRLDDGSSDPYIPDPSDYETEGDELYEMLTTMLASETSVLDPADAEPLAGVIVAQLPYTFRCALMLRNALDNLMMATIDQKVVDGEPLTEQETEVRQECLNLFAIIDDQEPAQ
jgi:hypothetical protein